MSEFNSEITSDDKLWAALTYALPIVGSVLVFIMADKKDRPFIKSHNVQALILGVIAYALLSVCGLGFFVWLYGLYCAYQAYQGLPVVIPVISDFVKNQGWA